MVILWKEDNLHVHFVEEPVLNLKTGNWIANGASQLIK